MLPWADERPPTFPQQSAALRLGVGGGGQVGVEAGLEERLNDRSGAGADADLAGVAVVCRFVGGGAVDPEGPGHVEVAGPHSAYFAGAHSRQELQLNHRPYLTGDVG